MMSSKLEDIKKIIPEFFILEIAEVVKETTLVTVVVTMLPRFKVSV